MENMSFALEVERSFYDYYSARGYEVLDEAPAYPSPDDSVLFIGAQISTWKPRVLSGESTLNSVANPQTCIRTQNLDLLTNLSEPMNFCTVFRTHGTLTTRSIHEALEESCSYLLEVLEIPEDGIVIKTTRGLLDKFDTDLAVEIDTEIPEYYVWEYGHPKLSGDGITLAVKNPDGEFIDIGNVIEIKEDGNVVAVEWGFGEEVLCNALFGGYHPLTHSRFLPGQVRDKIDSTTILRICDASLAIVTMAHLGVEPSHKGAGDILSRYIHKFGELAVISGMRSAESLLDEIAEYNFPGDEVVSNLVSKTYRRAGKLIYWNQTIKVDSD